MLGQEAARTVDENGRIVIPSKFRQRMGRRVVVSVGLNEKCLFIYPMDEWAKIEEKVRSLPLSRKDAQSFVRWLTASSSEETVDAQGRISIPQNLRDYAGIKREVVVVGVTSRLEVWDKEEWDRFMRSAQEQYSKIPPEIVGTGF